VGELKLDRTFIAGLADHHSGREFDLVRSTIDLGHALGLRVVAEGIEDKETLDLLSALGCDLAQGYFISRPKAAKDLAFRSDPSLPPAPSLRAVPLLGDDWLDTTHDAPELLFHTGSKQSSPNAEETSDERCSSPALSPSRPVGHRAP
jgi:hypothetical protein